MVARFGFIKEKKGAWEIVKTSNGPWMQYTDHEQALAEIERENVKTLAQIDEEHSRDLAEKDREIERLQAQLATAKGELEHWTHDSFKRREAALREALQGILDIGKRDMSNPKYDGYFATAREALKERQS